MTIRKDADVMDKQFEVDLESRLEDQIQKALETIPNVADFEEKMQSMLKMKLPEPQNPENKQEMEEVLIRHQIWLSSIKDPGAPIRGSRAILAGLDLRDFDFTDVDLSCADLSGSDLRGVSFRRANLTLVDFSSAKLEGAMFDDAVLESALIEHEKIG